MIVVANASFEKAFVDGRGEGLDPRILDHPGRMQGIEFRIENRVQPTRSNLAALETGKPDSIAHHDVVERAVDGLEERRAIAFELDLGKGGTDGVEAFVGEAVVARQNPDGFDQGFRTVNR